MGSHVYNDLSVHGSVVWAKEIAEFPAQGRNGEIVVKDGRHYAYTKISEGYYSWMPIGVKQSAYVHSQGIASTTWTIPHNLGTEHYGIFVYDTDHNLVMANHEPVDANTVAVTLYAATAGTAVVFAVTDFSATAFNAGSLTIGDVTLTSNNGELVINGEGLAAAAGTGEGIPYDVASYTAGKPSASEKVVALKVVTAFGVSADLAGSAFVSGVAATGNTVFSVKKNGVQFTTITFAAASTTGTAGACSATTFAAGDVLTIEAPATADSTLADIMISVKGSVI